MWNILKQSIINILKGGFITLALKKLLGTALGGGIKVWIIKTIATELFEEIGEPLIHFFFNEAEYQADVIEGKLNVKKLEKAKDENDQGTYDSAADDTFN